MLSLPDWVTKEMLFVIGSFIIAISIALQMLSLYRHQGKISQLPTIMQLLSFVDGAWFFVSAATLYFLNLNPLPKSIATIFILYMIASFVYAGTTMENKLPERAEDIIFAKRYMDFNLSFALVFALLCLLGIWSSTQKIHLEQLLQLSGA